MELGPYNRPPTRIVPSAAPPTSGSGLEFKAFSHARLRIALNDAALTRLFQACLDGDCGMTLIDDLFFGSLQLDVARQTRIEAVEVQGIGGARLQSTEFVPLTVYVPGFDNDGQPAIVSFVRDFHIVPDLKCKVLLGNDIAATEGFVVDFGKQLVRFPMAENITANIEVVKPTATPLPRTIQAACRTTIPPHTMQYVPINSQVLDERVNYELEPFARQTPLKVLQAAEMSRLVIDRTVIAVPLTNHSPYPLLITKHLILGTATPLLDGTCSYHLDPQREDHRRVKELMEFHTRNHDSRNFAAEDFWKRVQDSKGTAYIQEIYAAATRSYLNDLFADTARQNQPPPEPDPPPGATFAEKNFSPNLTTQPRTALDEMLACWVHTSTLSALQAPSLMSQRRTGCGSSSNPVTS